MITVKRTEIELIVKVWMNLTELKAEKTVIEIMGKKKI